MGLLHQCYLEIRMQYHIVNQTQFQKRPLLCYLPITLLYILSHQEHVYLLSRLTLLDHIPNQRLLKNQYQYCVYHQLLHFQSLKQNLCTVFLSQRIQ